MRRSGNVYGDPGEEDSIVWIIPNIGILGSKEGSYVHYINRLKIPILRYELNTFLIRPEDLPGEVSEQLCDELLDLRVYERMLPIDLLSGKAKGSQAFLRRILKGRH